jgi:hypothetical protein
MYKPIRRRVWRSPSNIQKRPINIENSEQILHKSVCQYLRYNYPDVIFISDQSGIAKSRFNASLTKQLNSSSNIPDLMIVHMAHGYGAFFIELKREGTRVWRQDGELTADKHIRAQAKMLQKLRDRGYMAEFGIGYAQTIGMLREYLGDPRPAPIEF